MYSDCNTVYALDLSISDFNLKFLIKLITILIIFFLFFFLNFSEEPTGQRYKSERIEPDYNKPEYKDIWTLRTALEAEVDKGLNDSCGDLSEILNNTNNSMKQSSVDNEDHELVRSIALSSSDQRLSKNDSGKLLEQF